MTLAASQNSPAPPQVRTGAAPEAFRRDGGIGEARREAEPSKVPMFTARQIAVAVGERITREAVHHRFSGIQPDGTKTVNGQKNAKAWRVESFPAALLAELESLCTLPDGTRRFRTVADLLTKMPARYKPAASAADFPDAALALAERKAEILAPLLSKRARTRMTFAALSRIASAHFAGFPGGKPSLRTIEAWAFTAERRDRGRHQFDRPELFLPDSAPMLRTEAATEADGFLFPTLETWIAECERPMPAKVRPFLWHAAFVDFEAAVGGGLGAVDMRRDAVERLAHFTSPLYPATRPALFKAWDRKLPVWQELGRSPEAIADARQGNAGRPNKFRLTRAESLALRNLTLKKDSADLAIEFFVSDPACRRETADMIRAELDAAARERRRPQWSQSLRRAASVSAEQRALLRGPKAFQNLESFARRGAFWEDENGERHPLAPNSIWESDDMSSNEPFQYVDPETGAIRVGRQTLFTMDVHAAFWLGVSPIGRERDAYRVEDIADHISELVEARGLPLIWRIERGIWENKFIHGIEVDGPQGPVKWGGLGALFTIQQAFKSKGKGLIESSFSFLQRLAAHESTSIGRHRGEFEQGTKLFLAAQRGDPDAVARFWTQEEYADRITAAAQRFNTRPKARRMHGKEMLAPADLYQSATRRECPADELWRFLPVKRAATVRGGAIECPVNHYPHPFRFAVNGSHDGIYLEQGHRVLIAFHPGRPEEGCHVFNAEMGAKNRDGRKFGERIGVMPLAPDSPQLSLTRDEQRFTSRKAANAAVRSEFRAIMKAGTPIVKSSEARDGFGNRVATRSAPSVQPAQADGRNRGQDKGDALIAGARAAHSRGEFDYDAEAARLRAEEEKANELPH
jgi:hypothetical protein